MFIIIGTIFIAIQVIPFITSNRYYCNWNYLYCIIETTCAYEYYSLRSFSSIYLLVNNSTTWMIS